MSTQAQTDHPIHELIAKRWSPYAFSERTVSTADLQSLFEAARWAPSSYNEQPWRFLVATRGETAEFDRLLSCLVEPNRIWARNAAALVLTIAARAFERNGKPNAAAVHDIGLASATLTLEATARGMVVHQMIGIEPERARSLYEIPPRYDAITALAIGYFDPGDRVPEALRKRDAGPRHRKPMRAFVFSTKFGEPADFA